MNPKGLGWDNEGNLFVTEMGSFQKTMKINLVQPGENYGWPEQECSGSEQFVDPINCYDPAIEPGGIVFYYDDKINLQGGDPGKPLVSPQYRHHLTLRAVMYYLKIVSLDHQPPRMDVLLICIILY